jgi:tetratricopeptide (TPR) repeat protein
LSLRWFKILTIISIFTCISHIYSQTDAEKEKLTLQLERQHLRVAQKYQQADEHEKAILILEKLYARRPGNIQYYSAYLESLIAISRTDDALILIDKQKISEPMNPRYEVDKATVLYKAGDKKTAKKIWKETLQQYQENVAIYTLVARSMLENGFFDEAVEVYKKGYAKHPARTHFLQNIASMYRNRMQYYEAMKYYLLYLVNEPKQANSTMRQVLSFRLEEDQVDSLSLLMEGEATRLKENYDINILLAKFYQKYKRFDKAFEVYRKIENSQTQGQYLLDFGRSMQADSVFHLAAASYEGIIQSFPESPYILYAYLGAAKSYLEMAQAENNQMQAEKAVQLIKKVREKYPDNEEVAELALVEGLIYKKFFFDIDKAIEVFHTVSNKFKADQNVYERTNLFLGECYIIRGDLNNASRCLKNIHSKHSNAQVLYYLAKIEFYRNNYQMCKSYLTDILIQEGVAGPLTNDALELQMLIPYSEVAPEALKIFAESDWLEFQGKKSQAITKLENALTYPVPDDMRAEILLKAANLSLDIDNVADALHFCNSIISENKMKLYADEALFLMGGIIETKLQDLVRAFQIYDQLLAEYPNSQYSHPARQKMKKIRELQQINVP